MIVCLLLFSATFFALYRFRASIYPLYTFMFDLSFVVILCSLGVRTDSGSNVLDNVFSFL